MIDVRDLENTANADDSYWAAIWAQAAAGPVAQDDAQRALACLWRRTLRRIAERDSALVPYYPTSKRTPNQLRARTQMWWVDHATEGSSADGTLTWFSNKPGGSEASTHFLIDLDGEVFYLVDLNDGAWHEPRRNADGWSVEMVNCCGLRPTDGSWVFSDGYRYPLTPAYPPQAVALPFRGCGYFQPYDRRQLLANIQLKRLVRAAYPGRLAAERMSQHTDWRADKLDCGPLWPVAAITELAFSDLPLASIGWLNAWPLGGSFPADPEVAPGGCGREGASGSGDPENATRRVQSALKALGFFLLHGVDGQFGPETAAAVRAFQRDWCQGHAADAIAIDGIPGVETELRLARACAERGLDVP
jgi:N-acetyl-anhydromuramyl-L-alanine amidase AmpD